MDLIVNSCVHQSLLPTLSFFPGRRRWILWILTASNRQSACLSCFLAFVCLFFDYVSSTFYLCHSSCQAALTLCKISLFCNKQSATGLHKFCFQRTNWIKLNYCFLFGSCPVPISPTVLYLFEVFRGFSQALYINCGPEPETRPLPHILTYSMEQSPSWEANWFCS